MSSLVLSWLKPDVYDDVLKRFHSCIMYLLYSVPTVAETKFVLGRQGCFCMRQAHCWDAAGASLVFFVHLDLLSVFIFALYFLDIFDVGSTSFLSSPLLIVWKCGVIFDMFAIIVVEEMCSTEYNVCKICLIFLKVNRAFHCVDYESLVLFCILLWLLLIIFTYVWIW